MSAPGGVTLAQVGAWARDLPGVKERRRGGALRWEVGNRLLARQLDGASIVIRTGFGEREDLLTRFPGSFSVPPRFDAHMMVVAELPEAAPAAVRAALQGAWDLQSEA